MMRHEVILHTKSGRSFRGILWRRWGVWLVLKQPALVSDEPQDLDGDMWVDRDNVDFLQVIR